MKISRIDQEVFLTEIIDNILNRTASPNLKHFEKEVAKYNEAISEVAQWLEVIDDEQYQQLFIEDITEKKARAKAIIANQGTIRLEALKAEREKTLQLKWEELNDLEEQLKSAEENSDSSDCEEI